MAKKKRPTEQNLERLLEKATRGNHEALAQVFLACLPRLQGILLARGWSSEDVKDITHDTFLRVLKNIQKDPPRRFTIKEFEKWITVIACNRSIDVRRSLTVRLKSESLAAQVGTREPGSEDLAGLIEWFEGELRRMSPSKRELASMTFVDRLSPAEIAERLGLRSEVVRQRIHKLRVHLRESLRRWKRKHE